MKLTLAIELDNAAFEEDLVGELRRIFRSCEDKVVEQLHRSPDCRCSAPEAADQLKDISGNTVGHISLETGS